MRLTTHEYGIPTQAGFPMQACRNFNDIKTSYNGSARPLVAKNPLWEYAADATDSYTYAQILAHAHVHAQECKAILVPAKYAPGR